MTLIRGSLTESSSYESKPPQARSGWPPILISATVLALCVLVVSLYCWYHQRKRTALRGNVQIPGARRVHTRDAQLQQHDECEPVVQDPPPYQDSDNSLEYAFQACGLQPPPDYDAVDSDTDGHLHHENPRALNDQDNMDSTEHEPLTTTHESFDPHQHAQLN